MPQPKPKPGKRLLDLEAKIEGNLEGFLAAGAALLEIRDKGLYRYAHQSFAGYLRQRWPQFGRTKVYQLISAAICTVSVRETDNSTPDCQGVAELTRKALAALPAEEQQRLVQEEEDRAMRSAGSGDPRRAQGGEGWAETLEQIERLCRRVRKLTERRGPECDVALPHLDGFLNAVRSWDG